MYFLNESLTASCSRLSIFEKYIVLLIALLSQNRSNIRVAVIDWLVIMDFAILERKCRQIRILKTQSGSNNWPIW